MERVEVLRRGASLWRSSPFCTSTRVRVVREKCRGVGTLLPACTSTDAATFFEFSKYSWFLSLVLYLVQYMLVMLVVE